MVLVSRGKFWPCNSALQGVIAGRPLRNGTHITQPRPQAFLCPQDRRLISPLTSAGPPRHRRCALIHPADQFEGNSSSCPGEQAGPPIPCDQGNALHKRHASDEAPSGPEPRGQRPGPAAQRLPRRGTGRRGQVHLHRQLPAYTEAAQDAAWRRRRTCIPAASWTSTCLNRPIWPAASSPPATCSRSGPRPSPGPGAIDLIVRLAGEMTWALRDAPGVEHLVGYESELYRVTASYPVIVLCLSTWTALAAKSWSTSSRPTRRCSSRASSSRTRTTSGPMSTSDRRMHDLPAMTAGQAIPRRRKAMRALPRVLRSSYRGPARATG